MGLGTVEPPVEVKGRWRVRVWWQDAGGRRRSVYVYGATEREALRLATARQVKEGQDAERERAGLLVRRSSCPTFSEHVVQHHAAIWPLANDAHRLTQLRRLSLWVEPSLGGKRLDELTRADLAGVVAAVRAQRSPATANRVLAAVSSVLKHAEDLGLLERNVARGGRSLSAREPRPEVETYSAEEVERLVAAAAADELGAGQWGAFIALAAYTGARPKSVRLLKVADVRLEADPPAVVFRKTKSGRDLVVPAVPPLVAALRAVVTGRDSEEYLVGGADRHGRPDPRQPLSETGYRKAWLRAVARAGVRPLTFYALRHSFGTLAIGAGMPATMVRDLMGHSSLAVTDRYAGRTVQHHQATALGGLWRGADVVQKGAESGEKE